MKVESFAERAFCNTFDLHKAIIGLKNKFGVFLRVAVLHRFYCRYQVCAAYLSRKFFM